MKKILKKFWERNKTDLLFIFFFLGLSFYAWRFILTWIIQFQGFMYFLPVTSDTYLGLSYKLLTTAQVAGVLLSAMLVKLVGVNMSLYMWIQLITMLFIGFIFYLYIFDYSAHLLERASINVIFMLISFLFFHLFLEKTKIKYYAISIIFYCLGILSSHFSI